MNFLGDVPSGFVASNYNGKNIRFPDKYTRNWLAALNGGTYTGPDLLFGDTGIALTAEEYMRIPRLYPAEDFPELTKLTVKGGEDAVRACLKLGIRGTAQAVESGEMTVTFAKPTLKITAFTLDRDQSTGAVTCCVEPAEGCEIVGDVDLSVISVKGTKSLREPMEELPLDRADIKASDYTKTGEFSLKFNLSDKAFFRAAVK